MNTANEKILRSKEDLNNKFTENLAALKIQCLEFDKGNTFFAAQISANLRVLLFNNPRSGNKSLLNQLGLESTQFADTTMTLTAGEINTWIAPIGGMAHPVVEDGRQGLIQNWQASTWIFDSWPMLTQPFQDWWNSPIAYSDGKPFSREKLVKYFADQDGGTHVDEKIDKMFYDLTRGEAEQIGQIIEPYKYLINSSGLITKGLIVNTLGANLKLARCIIRQIAHEAIISLDTNADSYQKELPKMRPGLFPQVFMKVWFEK